MKRSTAPAAQANRRASPDVVEKRRAARFFNDALLGGAGRPGLDGRTEKRRQRLLQELADGAARRGARELKPIDILTRVKDLLLLGEPLASIRKACPARKPAPATPEVVEGVRRLHRAYGFPREAYRFVGIDEETLRRAGIAEPAKTRAVAPGDRQKRPGLRATLAGRSSSRARA